MIESISEIIRRIINKLSHTNGYRRAWLERNWLEIVGETARKHSRPHKVDKGVLYVSVDSSVWNQALFIDKVNLINRINKKFTCPFVQDIKYQMGQFTISAVDQVESNEFLQAIGRILEESEQKKLSQERSVIWDRRILVSLINKKRQKMKFRRKYGIN